MKLRHDPLADKANALLKQIQIGNKNSAVKLEKLAQKKPKNPHVLNAMGCMLLERGDGPKSREYLLKAIDKGFPLDLHISRNLLITAAMCNDVEDFLACWERVKKQRVSAKARLEPIKAAYKAARFKNNLAVLEHIVGIWFELEPPDTAMQLSNIAMKLDMGQMEEAKKLLDELPPIDPDDFQNLMTACELLDKAKHPSIISYLNQAQNALNKANANDVQRLIFMASKLFDHKRALELLEDLVEEFPDLYQSKLYELITAYQETGNWDKVEKLVPEYKEAIQKEEIRPTGLWKALSWPGLSDKDHLVFANAYVSGMSTPQEPPADVFQREPGSGRKLRVGYLSADFKNHPVAQLLVEIIESHDKDRFETIAYDIAEEEESLYRQRILKAFDRVVHVRKMNDEELIKQIRDDKVDILVDLQGDTAYSRCWLFRHRLAPIQVNWLGYAGSTGKGISDYIIADKHVVPEEAFPYYGEHPAWMPDTFIPNDPQRKPMPAPPRVVVGLPEDKLVFCCFNGHYKINREIFLAWCEILHQVPDSVLWLKVGNEQVIKRFTQTAEDLDLDSSRIIFAQSTQYQTEHLTRLQCADIALDTRPYNSHTTGIDALWAGLPLITLPGQSFASRVAASVLHVAGLEELIATDMQDYINKAVNLAKDDARRKNLRQYLFDSRKTSVLFDSKRFTRNLESAFEAMFNRFEQGLEPAPLTDLKVPEKLDSKSQTKTSVQLTLEQAESYLKQEKVQEAFELFGQVLDQDPENAQALHGIGLIHGLFGRYEIALPLLQKAVSIAPDQKTYQSNLEIMQDKHANNYADYLARKLQSAMDKHQAGDFQTASYLYQEILDKSPRHPQALHYFGLLQIQQNNPSGLDRIKESLHIQPHNQEFLHNYTKARKLTENMKPRKEAEFEF